MTPTRADNLLPHLSWKVCFCVYAHRKFLQGIKENKQTSYWQPSKAANQRMIRNSRIDLHMSSRPTSEGITFLHSYRVCLCACVCVCVCVWERKREIMMCFCLFFLGCSCHWLLNIFWQKQNLIEEQEEEIQLFFSLNEEKWISVSYGW